MHVELVEIFRCIAPHRDSWLVAAADRTDGRVILDGTLGCPVCQAEYAIRNGVALFVAPAMQRQHSSPAGTHVNPPVRHDESSHVEPRNDERRDVERRDVEPRGDEPGDAADPNAALRLAAMLGASDASMTVALIGVSLSLAAAVQSIAPVRCIVIDAPDERDALGVLRHADAQLAVARANGSLPVARGALRGVYAGRGDAAARVGALRVGGRLVAPVETRVPAGIIELARDETHWVGERSAETSAAPASLVQLRRRR